MAKQYVLRRSAFRSADITLPTSKSISNRLLLINVLCHSPYKPENISDSDDTRVMLRAVESDCSLVDVGAAGTSMRFLTAYLSLLPGEHVITGSERMKQRPIALLVDALRSLGADIQYVENEGFPPLKIVGKELQGGMVILPGNVSSQYISALMMIAPMVKGGLQIVLKGKINSRPYIDMTLSVMKSYGVDGEWNDNKISIPEGRYMPQQNRVEADWSAASYWYEMAALCPQCTFHLIGLQRESLQGDSAVKKIAEALGVTTEFCEDGVIVSKTKNAVSQFNYDFSSQPDLAQTFVVASCLMNIKFSFTGLESLKIKETDRLGALVAELRKLGYVLNSNNIDTLTWNGERIEPMSMPIINTYKDHRMAMAFMSAVAVYPDASITIDDPDVVSKSYPMFWRDMQAAGLVIEEKTD
ncbi:MAG: 3-phosphoshikimate 1-carboxyvinyltransferase [Bacteroidales bacterium]|nr:3-phosphoshikimate 1-carboxyvinyltransferase [Bacteroidales bacterium]